MKKEYYVYVYLDTRKYSNYMYGDYNFDYEPIYIGKGKGNRYKQHLMEYNFLKDRNKLKINKIKKIIRETDKEPKIIIFEENLTEKQAKDLETKMISIIGRKDLEQGPLTNLTDGGEGSTGRIVSEKTRKKISKKNKKKIAWNKGLTKQTDDRIKQISEKLKGNKHTKSRKKNQSISAKKRSNNEGYKQKFVERMSTKIVKEKRLETIIKNKSFAGKNNPRWDDEIDNEKIKEMFLNGMSYYHISKKINKPYTTIKRRIQNMEIVK